MVKSNLVLLQKLPNIKWLLFRSLFKAKTSPRLPHLPTIEFCVTNVQIQQKKVNQFHQVVHWQAEHIHPCYIHTLAFPLHLKLLLEPSFPFPVLGLVHIENKIRQYRQLNEPENLRLTCHLANLEAHPKGWLFSIITQCHRDDELVWQGESVNLYRIKHQVPVAAKVPVATKVPVAKKVKAHEHDFLDHSPVKEWQLAENLGRLYAQASGDFNPIHLTKWSAKLFGFKQHIIHGMWTKSRCISEIQQQQIALFDAEFTVQVRFKLPLFLPANVAMLQQPTEQSKCIAFNVETQTNGQPSSPHLVGSIHFS